jgi:hypothetical protein
VVVEKAHAPTLRDRLATDDCSWPRLSSARNKGRGAAVQEVNGAGSGEAARRCNHPDGEVVVGDFQLHRPFEKVYHCAVDLSACEELESRAESALVNDLFTGLSRG